MQSYMTHIAKQGERWDSIAYYYYANPFAYGELIRANPHLPITPTLSAGDIVAVPIVANTNQDVIKQELPPWLI